MNTPKKKRKRVPNKLFPNTQEETAKPVANMVIVVTLNAQL